MLHASVRDRWQCETSANRCVEWQVGVVCLQGVSGLFRACVDAQHVVSFFCVAEMLLQLACMYPCEGGVRYLGSCELAAAVLPLSYMYYKL